MAKRAVSASSARNESATGFAGFGADALAFLRELTANQNREWFAANKDRYESEVLSPLFALVMDLGEQLRRLGLPLRADPKRAVFRIYRDTRFSKDKRPYKTHAAAALTRDGEKMSPGVLYLHIDPTGSFVGAGFYRPEPGALQAIRERIRTRPSDYRAMIAALKKRKLALTEDEDALKRLPRGFEKVEAPDLAEAVRRRTFIVSRPLTPQALRTRGLVADVAAFAEQAAPLLDFGWRALGVTPGINRRK